MSKPYMDFPWLMVDSDTDAAWAAGFFDGEGSTSSRPTQLYLQVAQKNAEPLDRLKNMFGGSIYRHTNGYWNWYVGKAGQVLSILTVLWSYLTDVKRQQADTAILKWSAA